MKIPISKLREAGIRYFSVTDHDTVDGAEYVEMHVPKDMVFIRGIEFSCIAKAGKCHILAYDYDRNASAFKTILEEGYNRRRNILEKRISFLKKEYGIELTEDELLKLRSMNSVGKPHLGNLLVDKGLAPDMISAIRQYINPCKSDSDRLDAAKVISAVTDSGGIPVWTHPLGGTGERALELLPAYMDQDCSFRYNTQNIVRHMSMWRIRNMHMLQADYLYSC